MKLSELFPRKYANGDDLGGRSVPAVISRVTLDEIRPAGKPPVQRPVLWVSGATRGVIMSRTLAYQVAEIVGSEDTDAWPGRKIVLYPVPMEVAGRRVVAIRARKPHAVEESALPVESQPLHDASDDDEIVDSVNGQA